MKNATTPLTLTTLPSALKLEAKLNTLLDRDQKEHHTAGGYAYLTGPDGGPLSGTEAEALIREGEEVFLHVQVNHWHHGRNGRRGDSCFEDHVSTFSFFKNLKAEQEGTGSGDGYEIVTYRVNPLSATKLKNLTEDLTRAFVARDEYPNPDDRLTRRVEELSKELPEGIVLDCHRAALGRIENRRAMKCSVSESQKREDEYHLAQEESAL